jgi:intein/homing endonuclease
MEFTKELLSSLDDEGRNICAYSGEIAHKLAALTPEDFSKFSSRSYYFWINNQRPIPVAVIVDIMDINRLDSINIESFSVSGGNKMILPDEGSLDFHYFLGLLLGDGCLIRTKKSGNRCTYLAQITFRYRKDAENILPIAQRLFGVRPTILKGTGRCYNLFIHSKPLIFILHKRYQIPMGLKYDSICVPNVVRDATDNQKIAFIKGVFESDGNIYNYKNRKGVQIRQKSLYFLNQLKGLLDDVGIVFNKPYSDKANNSWVLWSSKKELVGNFINKIIDFRV